MPTNVLQNDENRSKHMEIKVKIGIPRNIITCVKGITIKINNIVYTFWIWIFPSIL